MPNTIPFPGTSAVAVELTTGVITFTDAAPLTITCIGGTHVIAANSAPTVTTVGTTLTALTISVTAATTVNLSSLTTCAGLTLTVANPTLTLPADVVGAFAFTSTTRTALVIPGACTDVSITGAALTTITSIGTLGSALTNFSLNNTGAVDSTGIELILTRCAATGAACAVDISGGTNAAPTGTPSNCSGEIVCPAASALNASAAASWVLPRWADTEQYFWFNVDSGNTDPAVTDYGREVTVGASDTAAQVATALEAAMEANGYSSSVATATVSYTDDFYNTFSTAGSQDAGNDFTLQNEFTGSSGNASIDTIVTNGGTVTHN